MQSYQGHTIFGMREIENDEVGMGGVIGCSINGRVIFAHDHAASTTVVITVAIEQMTEHIERGHSCIEVGDGVDLAFQARSRGVQQSEYLFVLFVSSMKLSWSIIMISSCFVLVRSLLHPSIHL